ncbi:MAG: DUF2207 domain-containing protein [Woeseia sp.]
MKRLALLLLLPLVSAADERILSFHSDIVVGQDGWVEVTETIAVRAERARIKRGIYRDFPTRYRDAYGNNREIAYEPLTVLRNDARENFHTRERENGIRTYFGSRNRLLAPGIHTYAFRYRANRMLGFFDEHDELYWNVTGLEWAFPIDRASATVVLKFDGDPAIRSTDGFTGPMGSTGKDYTTRSDGASRVTFETTRVLVPHEGLTIVVAWPKGFVVQPTGLEKATWVLTDNVNLVAALTGLAAMLLYFIPVWRNFGRDPEEGLIVTRYEPPAGFSPASLRYIKQMYYDSKVMTAAVLSLAVKGYLRITESDDLHSLERRDPGENAPALATGERELLEGLFRDGDVVILDDEYHELLGKARLAHRKSLMHDYANRYFRTNGLLSIPGLLIGIVSAVIALNVGLGPTPAVIAVIVLMVVLFFVFAALMKRPTGLGRRVLDDMLGFKDYLEIAEKDEMNLRNPPEKTPQLFESYLPFALAMGVEQEWAERFANVLADLRGPDDSSYQPTWYRGSWNSLDPGAHTSSLTGGLNTAISSSVTPPGSASGGGGGGFSGGGGGGGGGGGW